MARIYNPVVRYIGAANKSDYTFDFKVVSLADILIIKTKANNEVVFAVRGTDVTYLTSVVMNANNVGGTVNLVSNLESGYKIVIRLAADSPVQEDRYQNQADFSLKKLENSLDYQNGAIQRLTEIAKHSIRLPDQLLNSEINPLLPDNIMDSDGKVLGIKVNAGVVSFRPVAAGASGDSARALYEEITTDANVAGVILLTKDNAKRIDIIDGIDTAIDNLDLPDVTTLEELGFSVLIRNLSSNDFIIFTSEHTSDIATIPRRGSCLLTSKSLTDNTTAGWFAERVEVPGILSYNQVAINGGDVSIDETCKDNIEIVYCAPGDNLLYGLKLPNPEIMNGRSIFIENKSGLDVMLKDFTGGDLFSSRMPDGVTVEAISEKIAGQWTFRAVASLNAGTYLSSFYASKVVATFLASTILTENQVPYVGPFNILADSAVNKTQLESLSTIAGNVQDQLDALQLEIDGLSYPISDSTFRLKAAGDATKLARFNVNNTAAGTTTHSLPAISGALAHLDNNVGNNNPVFNLTSGSVTYDFIPGNRREFTTVVRSGSGRLVTSTVSLKLSAISSPVNTALSIPMTIPPAAGVAGFKPSAAVRCNNCNLTGQLFVHVENGSSDYKLTIVNNGVETPVSAASFLTANSELHFTISYFAEYP